MNIGVAEHVHTEVFCSIAFLAPSVDLTDVYIGIYNPVNAIANIGLNDTEVRYYYSLGGIYKVIYHV